MFEQQSTFRPILLQKLNKFIHDEISAAVAYFRFAEMVKNNHIASELREHGSEEFEHFQELIQFAYKHGLGEEINIQIDDSVVNADVSSAIDILNFVQVLEKKAMQDYEEMSKHALQVGNVECFKFFSELMGDEAEHFDDLAVYLDQYRLACHPTEVAVKKEVKQSLPPFLGQFIQRLQS